LVLLSLNAAGDTSITIPRWGVALSQQYYTEKIKEWGATCPTLLSKKKSLTAIGRDAVESPGSLYKLRKLFAFANGIFEGRFTPEMVKERWGIAWAFKERSKYLAVRKGHAWWAKESDPIVGSIGVTWAGVNEDLPVERVLGIKLPRPTGKCKQIFELRTYAKDNENGPDIFPLLIGGAIEWINEMIQDCPDLYDQPVIYFYGDELSIRFYRLLGFSVDESITPVRHADTNWWVIKGTPRNLESLIKKFRELTGASMLNQPIPIKLPNGVTVEAAAGTSMRNDSEAVRVTPNADTEILPGAWAAKGGPIYSYEYQGIRYYRLSNLAKPFRVVELGLDIPAGSDVLLTADGHFQEANNLSAPVWIEQIQTTALPKETIQYRFNSETTAYELSLAQTTKSREVARGIWSGRGQLVTWVPRARGGWRPNLVLGIDQPYTTPDGTKFKAGEDIRIDADGSVHPRDFPY